MGTIFVSGFRQILEIMTTQKKNGNDRRLKISREIFQEKTLNFKNMQFFIFLLYFVFFVLCQEKELIFSVDCIYIFYLGFLSQTFTNHRTAGEGAEHFFISSLALPPASQTFRD